MKRIYLLLIYVFCYGTLQAQCPTGDVTLSTQNDINLFAFQYPDCTELLGNVRIEGSYNNPITDLSGLSLIKSIEDTLYINKNYNLINLSGLNSLEYIGGNLEIYNNRSLENLAGLESLNTIGGSLQIGYGEEDPFSYPSANGALKSLTGLENLSTVGVDLKIANNNLLTTISALEHVNFTEINRLEIFNNPKLSACNLTGICNYLTSNPLTQIYDNAPNCNSFSELLFICTDPMFCLNEGIIFTSQQQIDSFVSNYPDCQLIMGDVLILGDSLTSITNLSGLSQIIYIGGTLTIQDNAALVNLSGLESLKVAKNGLYINNNDGLKNLYALANLIDVQGRLSVKNNESLETLNGLHNITGPAISYLQIFNNPNLYECSFKSTCGYIFSRRNAPTNIYGNVEGNYNDGYKCGTKGEIGIQCPQYLPIELTDFQAQIQNAATLLTWQTATETDNEGFEIQRSEDGIRWEKTGWQQGQGTSTEAHNYTYTDQNPLSGTSYYRLKQMDFDGTFSHSDIVKIYHEERGISIHPNPVKNTLNIAGLGDSNIKHIAIYDSIGKQVTSQNSIQHNIDVSTLAPGMYIIKISLKNGIFCEKFIVEK